MALNTRNRRASAIGFDQMYIAAFPNPDGGLANVADRQQMAHKYSGISSGAVVTTTLFDNTFSLRQFQSPLRGMNWN